MWKSIAEFMNEYLKHCSVLGAYSVCWLGYGRGVRGVIRFQAVVRHLFPLQSAWTGAEVGHRLCLVPRLRMSEILPTLRRMLSCPIQGVLLQFRNSYPSVLSNSYPCQRNPERATWSDFPRLTMFVKISEHATVTCFNYVLCYMWMKWKNPRSR
jgi:hypothetical protein